MGSMRELRFGEISPREEGNRFVTGWMSRGGCGRSVERAEKAAPASLRVNVKVIDRIDNTHFKQ
jgi:hypothetical protein